MATVKFNVAIDMRSFAGYDFNAQMGTQFMSASSPTAWDLRTDADYFYHAEGVDLQSSTLPFEGTVTKWSFGKIQPIFDPSHPFQQATRDFSFWEFTGLSLAGGDFTTALTGDGAQLAAAMPGWLAGNDNITGSPYNDYLLGYAGNDVLNGGLGLDTLVGGSGNDTYTINSAGDKVIEDLDAGNDLVRSSISYTLPANVERLLLTGSEAVNGTGNALANTITGNAAANTLNGGGANDILNGAGGADTLMGGLGIDRLTGGTGSDQFLFNSTPNSTTNHDNIVDFSVVDDTIALKHTVYAAIATGELSAAAFFKGTAAHDADDRIIYNSATGNIYYDPDGNGSHAQVLFAHVTAGAALTNADFLVVA